MRPLPTQPPITATTTRITASCRRIKREVIDAERRAHEDALSAGAGPGGLVKVIERRKLEANIKEFVRQHVRKSTLQQVASGALPNAAMNGGGN